jgi:hypothetical protein
MNDIELRHVLTSLFTAFPSAAVEPSKLPDGRPAPGGGTAGAYARALRDLPAEAALAGIDRVVATHRFPTVLPAIAEIREAALALTAGEVKPGLVAWGEVGKLHGRFSTYKPPTAAAVADPIAWEALQSVGWRVLCMADETDSSPRARFIDAYDRLAAAGRRETVSKGLPAIQRLHELRAAERQALLPEAEGTTPIDQRTPRELNTATPIGELAGRLVDAAGGRR